MPELDIPVYQPDLSGNEAKYVNECLGSTWISSKGAFIAKFEEGFANFTGIPYAASVCNGTVALHAALLALGIKAGDEVIVPTLTYIASVNSITYAGATPVFVDSLESSWQMDPDDIERKITQKTKAIMVVHLYGQPCDMDKITELAKKHNLSVVEDCAEAIGTLYKGKHVGQFGDIATFSFFSNKTITTGEGGMVVSRDSKLINKVTHIKGQGLAEGREYWHDIIGYNYRMTNICAAIGCAQLERIDEFIIRKQEIAKLYKKLLSENVAFHEAVGNVTHSYWVCAVLVEDSKTCKSLRNHLSKNGIETRPVFPPIHTMPMYKNGAVFPVAEDIAYRGFYLPSWPGLSNNQVRFIVDLINNFAGG